MSNREIFDQTVAEMGIQGSLSNYLFYLHVIAACKVSMDEKLPAPAGVSFNKTYYTLHINPEMFGKFPMNERIGILAHEVLHVVFMHLSRLETRDHKLWNYATDMAINQLIKDIPAQGVHHDYFKMPKGLAAEEYYDLLLKEKEKQEQSGESGKSESDKENGNDKGETLDSHEGWANSSESDGEGGMSSQEISKELTRKITEDLVRKAQEKSRGTISSDLNNMIEATFEKEQLDWKKLVRNAFSNKKISRVETIKRRNRRFSNRPDVNGYKKNFSSNVICMLDVSGSVSDDFIDKTLSEVNGIAKKTNSDIKIIQVDTEVKSIEKFKKGSKDFTRKASGGTHLYPAVEYIRKNKIPCDTLVVFTDGEIENTWESPLGCQTVFVMEEGRKLHLKTENFHRTPIILNIKVK